MLDSILWGSGIFAWCFFGLIGVAWFSEKLMTWVLGVFWSQKEFLAFVWERLKSGRTTPQS